MIKIKTESTEAAQTLAVRQTEMVDFKVCANFNSNLFDYSSLHYTMLWLFLIYTVLFHSRIVRLHDFPVCNYQSGQVYHNGIGTRYCTYSTFRCEA